MNEKLGLIECYPFKCVMKSALQAELFLAWSCPTAGQRKFVPRAVRELVFANVANEAKDGK
jgi:hypothetical protein